MTIFTDALQSINNSDTNTKESNFLKIFRPFSNNNAPMVAITEANAKKLLDKHTKSGYIIVSASRGGNDFGLDTSNQSDLMKLNQINNERTKNLYKDIITNNLSFTPIFGGYVENKGTSDEEYVYEKSFIIYAKDRQGKTVPFDTLEKFGKSICEKYNQDEILVCPPDGKPHYENKNGDISMQFDGEAIFNDISQQYFSDLHKNTHKKGLSGKATRFSFNEIYLNPSAQCLSEHTTRARLGEICLGYKK